MLEIIFTHIFFRFYNNRLIFVSKNNWKLSKVRLTEVQFQENIAFGKREREKIMYRIMHIGGKLKWPNFEKIFFYVIFFRWPCAKYICECNSLVQDNLNYKMNYMPVFFVISIIIVILKFYELPFYSTNLYHINITSTLIYAQRNLLFLHVKNFLKFLKIMI